VLVQRGVTFMLSGSWTAKERKRTKITKTKVRQEVPEPDTAQVVAYARGELVSRSSREAAARGSQRREETPATAQSA